MGDAKAAARARLYRKRSAKHKVGDHSLCIEGNCSDVTPGMDGVMPTVTRHVGDVPDLGAVGQGLWDAMTAEWTPGPMHRAMLVEACRLADRLEQLDQHLKGKDWLRFRHRGDEGEDVEVVVYVDRVLAEAREQGIAFRGLAVELVKAAGAQKPAGKKGGGKLASVTALIPSLPAAR